MKKQIFSILSFIFIFSALAVTAKEALVIEAKETGREIYSSITNNGDLGETFPPTYRVIVNYDLILDDHSLISVTLNKYSGDENFATFVYDNFTISPGDTLNFKDVYFLIVAFTEEYVVLFYLQVANSVEYMTGYSETVDYFRD